MTFPPTVALLALMTVQSSLAQGFKTPPSQDQLLDAATKIVRESSPIRRARSQAELRKKFAELDAARAAANRTYKAAARVRQDQEIVDQDPETAGAVLSKDGDPNVANYLRLKSEYLAAKAELQKVEQAYAGCRLTTVMLAEKMVSTANNGKAQAFEKIKGLLQSGKVADPNPADPKSAVSFASSDPEIAADYRKLKADYISKNDRAAKAFIELGAAIAVEEALHAAAVQETPPTGAPK